MLELCHNHLYLVDGHLWMNYLYVFLYFLPYWSWIESVLCDSCKLLELYWTCIGWPNKLYELYWNWIAKLKFADNWIGIVLITKCPYCPTLLPGNLILWFLVCNLILTQLGEIWRRRKYCGHLTPKHFLKFHSYCSVWLMDYIINKYIQITEPSKHSDI